MIRYTEYNDELGRYVCPLKHKEDGTPIQLGFVTGRTEYDGTGKVIISKEPDIVFGEVIDRLAELETEKLKELRNNDR